MGSGFGRRLERQGYIHCVSMGYWFGRLGAPGASFGCLRRLAVDLISLLGSACRGLGVGLRFDAWNVLLEEVGP